MRFGSCRRLVSLAIFAGLATLAGLATFASSPAHAQGGAAVGPVPTFAKDIAPLFQAKCQSCHRPGTVAPMSLMTYEEVRPWARSIRNRVALREMPPWHVDPNVGIKHYKDDKSLTPEQIAMVLAWADNGAPLGDPKDMPPPVTFNDDEWTIGKPDLIVSLTEPDVVSAQGPDWWVNYTVETGLAEDRYIKAVETRVNPQGRKVVHHAIATLLQDETSRGQRRSGPVLDVEEGSYLSEYAVGKYGDVFPDGTGRFLKAGAKVRFNIHYSSAAAVGEDVSAMVHVGFVFYPKGYKPKYFVTDLFPHENDTIDIPPGQMARTDVYHRLDAPARIIGFQPHMHMRGKAMCMEAIHLDGSREMLSCVDRFDFNWHVMYTFEDDVTPLLPAGTMLHLIAIHDNTTTNRRNPDPSVWVGWGQRSIDDMAAAHINTQYLSQEDFDTLLAERKAAQARATGTQ